MKKILLAGALGLMIISCSKKENTAEVAASSETAAVSEPAKTNLSGDQIMETLDCSGCHSVNERMIGP
ncbi:MAG: cytochrome C, partial [Chryseobacterium culicis]